MNEQLRRTALPIALAFCLLRCDGGLQPSVEQAAAGSFSGLITYHHWPPIDSLKNLRIVAFRQYPVPSIVSAVLQNLAAVYPPITDTALVPYYVDSLRYRFPLQATTYQLVVIAQQYGPNLYQDWRVVGEYDSASIAATPLSLTVPPNADLPDINIEVDFSRPLTP